MSAAAERLFVYIVIIINIWATSIDLKKDTGVAEFEGDHVTVVGKDLRVLGGEVAWITRRDADHASDEVRFGFQELPCYWTAHGVWKDDNGLADDVA